VFSKYSDAENYNHSIISSSAITERPRCRVG